MNRYHQEEEVDALHPEECIGKTLEQLEETIQNNEMLINALRIEIHELQDEFQACVKSVIIFGQ